MTSLDIELFWLQFQCIMGCLQLHTMASLVSTEEHGKWIATNFENIIEQTAQKQTPYTLRVHFISRDCMWQVAHHIDCSFQL
jgi:hypothetical protein